MRRTRLAAAGLLTPLVLLSRPAQAQSPGSDHHPTPILSAVSGEWLHVGGEALHRDATQSLSLTLAHDRPSGLRVELGYLRAARERTNAEGATAAVSLPLRSGRVTVRPGLAMLVGAAEASVDRAGYNWRDADGTIQTGHQGRPLDSNGTTVGGGLSLGAEVRVGAGVSLAASVRQWVFSGQVLRADRASTLMGLGLSVHPSEIYSALRGAR